MSPRWHCPDLLVVLLPDQSFSRSSSCKPQRQLSTSAGQVAAILSQNETPCAGMQLKPSCTLWGPKQSLERTFASAKKQQFFCETGEVLSTALPKAYPSITPATEELSDASFSSVPWGASHISHTPRTITKLCGYVPTAGCSKAPQSHINHCCFEWVQLNIGCARDRLHRPAQLPSNFSFRPFFCATTFSTCD